MSTDIILVLGSFLAVISVPSLISALVDRRLPWVGVLVLIVGCGLVYSVYREDLNAFRWQDIPEAVVRVVAEVLK